MFSDQLSNANADLKELEYIASAEQQQALNEFVQKYVFSTQQEGNWGSSGVLFWSHSNI